MTVQKSIRCPKCNGHVLQKSESGARFRIKGTIRSDADGLHANCRWCSAPVTLPLDIVMKSHAPAKAIERFVLRPNKPST